MNNIRRYFAGRKLYRSRDDTVLGGVCSGLGRRVGLKPWPARMLFLLVLMVMPGSQLLIYPILWVLMPLERQTVAGDAWREAAAAAS